jgi:hypothetical protein
MLKEQTTFLLLLFFKHYGISQELIALDMGRDSLVHICERIKGDQIGSKMDGVVLLCKWKEESTHWGVRHNFCVSIFG